MKKESLFFTEIPILIQHINYGNHLGHDSLISLLHEARIRFLKHKNLAESGLIMTELTVKYKSEAFSGETLKFYVDVVHFGHTHFDLVYRVLEKASQRVVAEATTKMVFYDYDLKKVVKIPHSFLNDLKAT